MVDICDQDVDSALLPTHRPSPFQPSLHSYATRRWDHLDFAIRCILDLPVPRMPSYGSFLDVR
jgi:hypothetical protein